MLTRMHTILHLHCTVARAEARAAREEGCGLWRVRTHVHGEKDKRMHASLTTAAKHTSTHRFTVFSTPVYGCCCPPSRPLLCSLCSVPC